MSQAIRQTLVAALPPVVYSSPSSSSSNAIPTGLLHFLTVGVPNFTECLLRREIPRTDVITVQRYILLVLRLIIR